MKLRIIFITLLTSILLSIPVSAAEADSVRVAVIDTGISETAIAKTNLSSGQNYILPHQSTVDTIGHGTAIASIIVGSKKAGIEGICPEAVLVPLVYYVKDESGDTIKGDTALLAKIIRDAVEVYNCDIINISSGVLTDTPALRDTVAWAQKQGVLIISSAGNDGNDTIYYPGAYEGVLCVGASNEANSAPADFSNHHKAVDLLAPGEKLSTATMKGNRLLASGSSFSAAYISGVAAKLMTEYGLTATEIWQILCASATDYGTSGYDKASGWGILNLEQALDYAQQGRFFQDVDSSKWYFNAVNKAAKLGLVEGTNRVLFSPNQLITRSTVWTMLYRLERLKSSKGSTSLYSDAKEWVVANGISDGKKANSTVTREQMAAMMYRYAKVFGYDIGKQATLSKFTDANKISTYAKIAISWAYGNGLVSATGKLTLSPQGNITRAQAAVILTRFYDIF